LSDFNNFYTKIVVSTVSENLMPTVHSLVLGGTMVLPWNRSTSFSRYQYRRDHGTTVVPQYH